MIFTQFLTILGLLCCLIAILALRGRRSFPVTLSAGWALIALAAAIFYVKHN